MAKLVLIIILIFCNVIWGKNDGGIINKTLENEDVISFIGTIDKGSNISLTVTPIKEKCEATFHYYVRWIALQSTCINSFIYWKDMKWLRNPSAGNLDSYFDDVTCIASNYDINNPGLFGGTHIQCNDEKVIDLTNKVNWNDMYRLSSHNKRSDIYTDVCNNNTTSQNLTTDACAVAPLDGTYMFVVFLKKIEEYSPGKSAFTVTMQTKTTTGYLDVIEYPLLKFYGVLCIFYVIFTIIWSVISCRNFEYLGLYQNLITIMLLLSTIESTIFYSYYIDYNTTGDSNKLMHVFGIILAGVKHAVLCTSLILIGVGYKITKKGQTSLLCRVIAISMFYFILAMVQAFIKNGTQFEVLRKSDNAYFFSWIPMISVQVIIAFWVFLGLSNTIKTVKQQKYNVKKITLYYYFLAAVIVFYILAIIINVGNWMLINMQCFPYSVLWKVESSLKLLYLIMLIVLSILWYPNNASSDLMFFHSNLDEKIRLKDSVEMSLVDDDEI